jgi:hypothetical protein
VKLARTAATFEWGWSAGELERLVAAAGWTWREPSEGTVNWGFDAGVGAFVFHGEVTAVYQNLVSHEDAGVLARRDGFHRAVGELAEALGPPPIRVPGPDPSAGWRVSAGVLDVVDRPGALDLWLRPGPRETPSLGKSTQIKPSNWADFTEAVAVAAACLPVDDVIRIGAAVTLTQEADQLRVALGGATTSIDWPTAGVAYAAMAADVTAWLRGEAGAPEPCEIRVR